MVFLWGLDVSHVAYFLCTLAPLWVGWGLNLFGTDAQSQHLADSSLIDVTLGYGLQRPRNLVMLCQHLYGEGDRNAHCPTMFFSPSYLPVSSFHHPFHNDSFFPSGTSFPSIHTIFYSSSSSTWNHSLWR